MFLIKCMSRCCDIKSLQNSGALTVILFAIAKTEWIFLYHMPESLYESATSVSSRKFRRSSEPTSPDFSGWNCTPMKLSFLHAAVNSLMYLQTAVVYGPGDT